MGGYIWKVSSKGLTDHTKIYQASCCVTSNVAHSILDTEAAAEGSLELLTSSPWAYVEHMLSNLIW